MRLRQVVSGGGQKRMNSDLKRPPEKMIRSFRADMVGTDTVGDFLRAGHSLVICCKDCPHIIEWTPPELERRFGAMPQLRIADLVPRLCCAGERGCGAKDVAVFPQFYHGMWKWPPSPGADLPSDG